MKKKNRFLLLTALTVAFSAGQLQAEECADDCSAYVDSGKASYMAALLPIGALVVAAVIIATTDSGHHHHSSSSSSSSSKSSGHHHHRRSHHSR